MTAKRYDTTRFTYRVHVFPSPIDDEGPKMMDCGFKPAVVDEAEDGSIVCFESFDDYEIWLERPCSVSDSKRRRKYLVD